MFPPERPCTLWLCVDCMFEHELPDSEECLSLRRRGEVQRALRALTSTGRLFNDSTEDSGQREFSWCQCDCCNSKLGGSRHRYTWFPNKERTEA